MKKNILILILGAIVVGLIILLIVKQRIFIDIDKNILEFSALAITLITLIVTSIFNYKSNKNTEKQLKQAKEQFNQQQVKAEEHLNQQLSSTKSQLEKQLLIAQDQFEEQQNFLKIQQFETTFFNMMNQLENIVSKLTIEEHIPSDFYREKVLTDNGKEILNPKVFTIKRKGREVFEYLFKNARSLSIDKGGLIEAINKLLDNSGITNEDYRQGIIKQIGLAIESLKEPYRISFGIKSILENLGIIGYEYTHNINLLDHYFRYLYRIMKFIDEYEYLDKNERYKYMGILRATLSPYELVFLFYNDLSKYGNEKVKPLIERYSIFKSLRKELLTNSISNYDWDLIEDYDEYQFDVFDNDYDRYIEKTSLGEVDYERDLIYKASAISKIDNKFLLNE